MFPNPLDVRLNDIERGMRKSRVSTVLHTISKDELRDACSYPIRVRTLVQDFGP